MKLIYLSKEEAKPYKKIFMDVAKEVIKLAKKDGFSICFSLVGSSKRNMILVGDNKFNFPFDFDYQLLIMKDKNDKSVKETKDYFLNSFREKFLNEDWEIDWNIQDSTSAITIKNKEENYSYDVVIMKPNPKTLKANILKHYKDNNNHTYSWEEIPEYKAHKEHLRQINGPELWSKLRDIYKDKKETDTQTKSYLLFIESVNDLAQGI